MQYSIDKKLIIIYKTTTENSLNGQAMINTAYPLSWEKIKLSSLSIPKTFDNIYTNADLRNQFY